MTAWRKNDCGHAFNSDLYQAGLHLEAGSSARDVFVVKHGEHHLGALDRLVAQDRSCVVERMYALRETDRNIAVLTYESSEGDVEENARTTADEWNSVLEAALAKAKADLALLRRRTAPPDQATQMGEVVHLRNQTRAAKASAEAALADLLVNAPKGPLVRLNGRAARHSIMIEQAAGKARQAHAEWKDACDAGRFHEALLVLRKKRWAATVAQEDSDRRPKEQAIEARISRIQSIQRLLAKNPLLANADAPSLQRALKQEAELHAAITPAEYTEKLYTIPARVGPTAYPSVGNDIPST